jgi:hypothetical protein
MPLLNGACSFDWQWFYKYAAPTALRFAWLACFAVHLIRLAQPVRAVPLFKAVLKPPQSKRCRVCRAASKFAQRLDCGAFTSAFGVSHVEDLPKLEAPITFPKSTLTTSCRWRISRVSGVERKLNRFRLHRIRRKELARHIRSLPLLDFDAQLSERIGPRVLPYFGRKTGRLTRETPQAMAFLAVALVINQTQENARM